jgi:hypothetical protein
MIETCPAERRPELVRILAVSEQSAPAVQFGQAPHHLGPDPPAGHTGSYLKELNFQPLPVELRHARVVRVDAARVVELDSGDLRAILPDLDEPWLAHRVVAGLVPPAFVLVGHRPIERRCPGVLVSGTAPVVDELQAHDPQPTTDGAGLSAVRRSLQRVDTGFGPWALYTACRLRITHYYEPGDTHPECLGTGFLVEFPNDDNRLGLVTNRHLVDVPWAKPARQGTTLELIEVEWWQSETLRLRRVIKNPQPLFHGDPSIDVAVVPVMPDPDSPMAVGALYGDIDDIAIDPQMDGLLFNHGLSWPYLLKCEQLWPQLRAGELVAFPGYPIWYDKAESRPVFRSGMIASDPHTDYRLNEGEPTSHDGNRQILFDAFSTSGNSGSPVFVAQRGIAPVELKVKLRPDDPAPQAAAKLDFDPYHPSFLVGINAGHFNEHSSDHAGLSRMHKLSAIIDILRANESAPDPTARQISVFIPVPDDAEA